MALQGAEVLLYPTAIGSEPDAAGQMDTSRMWQRVMIGHAVANACYLGAANRVGTERIEGLEQSFYGCSFIADYTGGQIAEAGRTEEAVLVAPLDLAAARSFRSGWDFSGTEGRTCMGLFSHRTARPDANARAWCLCLVPVRCHVPGARCAECS